MLSVKVLRTSAVLAEIAQDTDHATRCQKAADALKFAINLHLWSEEAQAYRDAIHSNGELSSVFSMQVQVLALLCQVAENERANQLTRYLQPPAPSLANRLWLGAMSEESVRYAAERGLGLLLGRVEHGVVRP